MDPVCRFDRLYKYEITQTDRESQCTCVDPVCRFDRLYKYEITDVLTAKGLDVQDAFHIEVTITAQNGSALCSCLIQEPSVVYQSKSRESSGCGAVD